MRSARAAAVVTGPALPLFLCGTGGGGTSLLLRLLDGHPDLAVLPDETQLYSTLTDRFVARQMLRTAEWLGWRSLSGHLAGPLLVPFTFRGRAALRQRLRRWAKDFPDAPREIEGLVDRVTAHAQGPAGAWTAALRFYEEITGIRIAQRKWWVEKTPGNERFTGTSERLFRGVARYLHVVRDPRDMIASRVQSLPPGRARDALVIERAVLWARSLGWARHSEIRLGERYRVVRFEDLLARTAQEMSEIAGFLGVPEHPSLLQPTIMGHVAGANSSFSDARAAPGVVRSQAGRHAEVLSMAEIAFVESMLAPEMVSLGYPLAGGGADLARPAWVRASPRYRLKVAGIRRVSFR